MTQEDETQIGELLQQTAGELNDMVVGVRVDGRIYYVSASVENVLGYSDRDFLRLYNHSLDFEGDHRFLGVRQFIQRQLGKLKTEMQTGYACEPEALALNHRDGFRVSLNVQCIPSLGEDKQLRGAVCICRDVSNRKHKVDDVALADAVFDNSMIGIYVTDAFGKIIQANNTFSRITGYAKEEVIGNSPRVLDVERYTPEFLRSVRSRLEARNCWEGEIQHRHKDGHVFTALASFRVLRDSNGKIVNTIGYFSDVTEQRNSQNKIHRLAYFDPVTGLPNTSLFTDRLTQAIAQSRRRGGSLAVMLMDLDHFSGVNDTLGHCGGDALLQQVARRIDDCTRAEDTVARLDEDKFAVILAGLPEGEQAGTAAALVAEKIRASLAQDFVVAGEHMSTAASVGIASYPQDGGEAKKLLQHAETALILAKASATGGYQFYAAAMDNKVRQRRKLETELMLAFKAKQFEVHYQPLYSAASGEPVACEALLRWRHPQRGLLPAAEFIGLAEQTGLLQPLGDWVLRQACEQWQRWQNSSVMVPRMCVNLSNSQLADQKFVPALREIFARSRMPAGALQLEVRECVLLQDPQRSMDALDELQRLGVRLAIDGFGADCSALANLNRYPVDAIKIDRSVIAELASGQDQRLLQGLVALAKCLNLSVAVVGVETRAQLQLVRRSGCDEVQGFHFSAPRQQIQATG